MDERRFPLSAASCVLQLGHQISHQICHQKCHHEILNSTNRSYASHSINYYYYYHLTALWILSRNTWVSQYQKGKTKTNLDFLEQDTVRGSRISWAICKSAPRPIQTTMPAPHHSVFYRPDALPATQPTVSKHQQHQLQTKE